jgi:hypothetical protein
MAMNSVVLSCLALLGQTSSDGKMDASQFAKVLAGLHAPIRDVEMICEGEYRVVNLNEPADVREANAKTRDLMIQSNFAYRSDGKAILDTYEKLISDNTSMSHRTFLLSDHRFETRIIAGSYKSKPAPISVKGGDDSINQRNGSPGRFNFLLFWNRHLAKYPDLPGYQCDGWEKIDGHDCLKVTIEGMPVAPGAKKLVFWMDMNRGGHALKQEFYNEGTLWFRKHNIQLAQFKLPDGTPIWFPIRGEYDTYTYWKGPTTSPVFHEVESVVQGSLVFNQGIPDARFSFDWHGTTTTTPSYQAIVKSFDAIPEKVATPPLRRDPAGVQAHQKERLAEAEVKSAPLQASPSARSSWAGSTAIQATLTAVGIVVLVLAYRLRSR